MYDLILKNAQVFKGGKFQKLDLAVKERLIAKIEKSFEDSSKDQVSPLEREGAKRILDLRGQSVFPGFIDSQVHFREPGLTHKEDIESGSKAAACGGICTFFEMPNTNPPTTTAKDIAFKVQRAKEVSPVNFAFFMGATQQNLEQLKRANELEGCCGIKIFLGSSTGELLLYERESLLRVFRETRGMISCHSENEDRLQQNIFLRDRATTAHAHPLWRDVETALSSTKRLIALAREAGRRVHILHISTKEEMEFLRENKDICSVEVLPQHLSLCAPHCYDRLGTYAQMNPPLRTKEHQQALWEGIANGTVDVIGSDHAPHTREEKDRGYPQSPSGMPGVQTLAPLMLDHVHRGHLTFQRLVELMAEKPSQLWGLNKGSLEVGKDADFSVFNLKEKFEVKGEDQRSKSGWTPYEGFLLQGKPTYTIVGGVVVMKEGEIVAKGGRPAC